MSHRILITPTALGMLKDIADRRVRGKIASVIDRLASDPEKQGKPLAGDLAGFRSIRAVGQRYRIIYKVVDAQVVVFIVAVGIRREGAKTDIYSLAKKLFRLKLLEPPS